MEIVLKDIGKQFNQEWIFRHVDFTFTDGSVSAILGRNGSGKSTLLQVIAGSMMPTAGTIKYFHHQQEISAEGIFRNVVIVAPYLELIEEFTMEEMIRFHFSFKKFLPGTTQKMLVERLGLHHVQKKPIRNYSSGMKQRLKLILAMFSDVQLIFLDEPSMNLDTEGIDWYHGLVQEYRRGRTLIICTNMQPTEAAFAGQVLKIEEFKPQGWAMK